MRLFCLILLLCSLFFSPRVLATAFFEVGEISIGDTIDNANLWVTVPLQKTYVNPVVIAGPTTNNNARLLVPRIQNVGPSSFQIGLQNGCEAEGAGFCTPPSGGWVSETVQYWVMEEGAWEFPDGQEIEGHLSSVAAVRCGNQTPPNCTNQNTLNPLNFLHNYAGTTMVMHSVNSFNDANFVSSLASRHNSRSHPPQNSSASVIMELLEVRHAHNPETIGWVVSNAATGTNLGKQYSFGRSGNNKNSNCNAQTFTWTGGVAPNGVVKHQTERGGNGSVARLCNTNI